MKTKFTLIKWAALLVLLSTLNLQLSTAFAQGTAFTYQGRLNDGGSPAGGTYNLTFTLFATNVTGVPIAGPVTNSTTVVSNGLFTVMIDFGASAFTGGSNWLEIGVETNGASPFTTLAPRQQLTPVPYAIFANTASNLSGTLPTTQLSGSLPANQLSGTLTLTQLPGAVVTNNATGLNLSGAFNGSYSGNGSGLTNVSGALPWKIISGTTQQAQSNTGYIVTNNSQVMITLPASPNIGDVVRISSTGTGGWKIAQNASQFVYSGNLVGNIGVVWTPHNPSTNWIAVASSADGTKLVAVTYGSQIYTSPDSGGTWTAHGPSTNWVSVASSADGIKLVAGLQPGPIYTSTDSGVTWTAHGPSTNWTYVASSSDGTKLVGVVYGGQISTSTDSGVTWTAHGIRTNWVAVASSSDGTKLVAESEVGQIYTSTDSGTNWTAHGPSAPTGYWASVASSSDGTKLVAADNHGQIYTSTDSGTNWTARDSNRLWYSVASSSDGTKLVAVEFPGYIFTSTDSGVTWTERDSNRSWNFVASSADGTKLVATVNTAQIYTSVPSSDISSTSTGATGYLLGNQNSAIELQYLGDGQFIPISFVGAIQSF